MSETLWPVVLLVLRISVAGMLYLFLAIAFRALYAELRPARAAAPEPETGARDDVRDDEAAAAEAVPRPAPAPLVAAAEAPANRGSDTAPYEEPGDEPEDEPVPGTGPRRERSPARLRPAVVVPIAALAAIGVLGAAAFATAGVPGGPGGEVARAQDSEDRSGPPVATPAAGRVTVGLAAVEDSNVRVTVDGVVQFDAVLRAGQARLWEGGERIQVWTDTGKTLQISVNGQALGPYSPAMGHPDWNRIDFGFWPGWPG